MRRLNYDIYKKKDGTIYSNLGYNWEQPDTDEKRQICEKVLQLMRNEKSDITFSQQAKLLEKTYKGLCVKPEGWEERTIDKKELTSKLVDFFKDVEFSLSIRFINTIANLSTKEQIKSYIFNYFNVAGNGYTDMVKDKLNSEEASLLLNNLISIQTSKRVNSRFKLYYGPQGTGKTTKALQESENRCIVCHQGLASSDLLEDFTFDDGKATFHPSILVKCMEEGLPIVLDEINMLPFESLRFLQGILDGKESFDYKGNVIHIKEGFKVIGTMNLIVNGQVYNLPEPLVDRAEDIIEMKDNVDLLSGGLE